MNVVESCPSCGAVLAPEADGAAVCVACALALALEMVPDGDPVLSAPVPRNRREAGHGRP